MNEREKTQRRIAKAYHDVFTSESGRVVLKDLMTRCRVLTPVYVAQDPHTTIWNDARRCLIVDIIRMAGVEKDDEKFVESALSHDPFEHLSLPEKPDED